MKYLVKCGENNEAIDVAIQTVKAANNELLTQQLFQYLTGEEDKIEKVGLQPQLRNGIETVLRVIHVGL